MVEIRSNEYNGRSRGEESLTDPNELSPSSTLRKWNKIHKIAINVFPLVKVPPSLRVKDLATKSVLAGLPNKFYKENLDFVIVSFNLPHKEEATLCSCQEILEMMMVVIFQELFRLETRGPGTPWNQEILNLPPLSLPVRWAQPWSQSGKSDPRTRGARKGRRRLFF